MQTVFHCVEQTAVRSEHNAASVLVASRGESLFWQEVKCRFCAETTNAVVFLVRKVSTCWSSEHQDLLHMILHTCVDDLLVILILGAAALTLQEDFYSLWSLDEVTSNILWESHEPLSHVLPLSPSCSVMSVVAWRHLPASRSPQQSDWHLCANLTKERPATKERPWGSVSLALYSSYRRLMEWQHFSFSMQLYLLRTLLSPRWISECPKLPEISRGGKPGN